MNKREFQQKYAVEAGALLHNPHFQIALDVAREDCPYLEEKAIDPTSIIRNEGKIQGWNACLKFLKTIAKSEIEPSAPKPTPLYGDPDKRKTDQNQ